MRQNRQKALYEKIMRNISREVKRALNEDSTNYYIVSYEVVNGRKDNQPSQWFGPYNKWDLDKRAEVIKRGLTDMINGDSYGPPDETIGFSLSYISEDELADILGYSPEYLANTASSISSFE